MNNTLCPYTALPVSSIKTNREHIVPDALGGANGFALKADAQTNVDYGGTVDSWLIHSPVASMLAAQFGVHTRSGTSVFKARGALVADASPVDVELGQNLASFRSRVPVVKDENSGAIVAVRGFGPAAENELSRVAAGVAKKGLTVVPGERALLDSEVRVPFVVNRLDIAHGLGKIAYLATVWTLGDSFIPTAGAARYRAWINAEHTEAALSAIGLGMLPTAELGAEFGHMSKSTHILTCTVINGKVATFVRLFNNDLLSFGSVVDIPELQIMPNSMRIISIDSVQKSIEERIETLA
jgi:hypothetical protein